jgi:LPXTG-motif cell wall-anchored protein
MTNEELIYNTARNAGVPDTNARLIVAQAIHETSYKGIPFNSNVFLQNNNAFGMKLAGGPRKSRQAQYISGAGTAAPASEGSTPYAKYPSVKNSVLDLIDWLQFNNINWAATNTPESYAAFLKNKGYYGDTLAVYTNALVTYFARLKDKILANKKPLLIILGLALIATGVYIYIRKKKIAG